MANYTLAPEPWQTFFYSTGAPVAAGQLFTYQAGTATPATTYSTSAGTANANPIILDAAGRCAIYLAPGSYRFDLFDSVAAGGALIRSQDNISAVPTSSTQPSVDGIAGEALTAGNVVYLSDGSGGKVAGRWYQAKADNAYSSTTPEVGFVPADIASGATGSIIQIGRITVGITVTAGLDYYISTVTAGAITSTPPPSGARFVGVADSGTSLIVDTDRVKSLGVAQGGTGDTTLTAHGVLVGEGTSPVVALSPGLTGQVLTSAGASADPAFASPTFQLLFASSGTDTNAGATTVASFALSGLTVKDSLWVVYNLESVTQNSTAALLTNSTDGINIVGMTGGAIIANGTQIIGHALIQPRQGSTVNLLGLGEGLTSAGARSDAVGVVTVTTAWTGTWVLGLRYSGVGAGGTFKYVWAVYQLRGQ